MIGVFSAAQYNQTKQQNSYHKTNSAKIGPLFVFITERMDTGML
jgi:hypothetical protein